VFGAAPPERRIPFTVADVSLRAESAVVEAFLELLELPESRYEASRLVALLAVDAVRRRFGMTEADLALVRRWVRESGVRWGTDAGQRAALGLPETAEHTWRFGLDRLLLGYAMRGEGRYVVGGVLPYDDVEGTPARALGRLAAFADAACGLRARPATGRRRSVRCSRSSSPRRRTRTRRRWRPCVRRSARSPTRRAGRALPPPCRSRSCAPSSGARSRSRRVRAGFSPAASPCARWCP